MAQLRIAIQTVLLPGRDLQERFASAAHFGFGGVETAVGADDDLDRHRREWEEASRASGLPVAAICTTRAHDPLQDDSGERVRRFAVLTDLLALADDLGAAGVVSVPLRPARGFANRAEQLGWLEELSDQAVTAYGEWAGQQSGGPAAVFLEPLNRYEASFLNRVGQAADIAARIRSPRVRALADLFHMNIEETDPAAPIVDAGELLGHVHIADNNRLQPGAGAMDIVPAFAALQQIGFHGWVSMECYSPFGAYIEGDPETALPETVRYLRSQWSIAVAQVADQDGSAST
jgi:sugar phosphate isomerase/epimerase